MRWDATYKGNAGAQQITHNHGLYIIVDTVAGWESSGSNNYRKYQLSLLFCTKKDFNEHLHVPNGDPCCHQSWSISVPFHPALLLQTDIHYSFHLLGGRATVSTISSTPSSFKCWVYFGWSLYQSTACEDSNCYAPGSISPFNLI